LGIGIGIGLSRHTYVVCLGGIPSSDDVDDSRAFNLLEIVKLVLGCFPQNFLRSLELFNRRTSIDQTEFLGKMLLIIKINDGTEKGWFLQCKGG
jgi:hypothetical protein